MRFDTACEVLDDPGRDDRLAFDGGLGLNPALAPVLSLRSRAGCRSESRIGDWELGCGRWSDE